MIHGSVVSLAMHYFPYLIFYFILSFIFGVLACSLSLPSAAGVPEFPRTDENCFIILTATNMLGHFLNMLPNG